AFTVALCSLWPALINTSLGVASIDNDYLNVARVLKLGWWKKVTKIVIPSSLPLIFTGLRLSLSVGWMVLIAAEPVMRWSHLVLLAAILTVVYAAVVSLALPDHWEAVRSDLALVALWIAIATGSSLAIAGATFILIARATSALAGAAWMVPHREYVALVVGSTLVAAGCAALAVGALGVPDAIVAALGALAAVLLLALELAQVARRFRVARVPPDLDVTSALAAFLATLLAAAVLAVPLAAVVRDQLTDEAIASPLLVVGIAVAGTLLVVLARTVRPLLPYVELAAGRSRPAISALDPVPLGVGTFRAIEIGAGRASVVFALFEQRAGVWLATLLIVGLLVWSTR
ncbi:MAG: ABC transporter permease subunit, partial [Chloroflexota bacterium]